MLGAGAERWRFGAYLAFAGVWSLLVYAPVAHWVFDPRGWAATWGMLDFAGGTVVHITAGTAALAVAITLGRRRGWPEQISRPHNLPLVMIGLAMLWFGWMGFNGGSAYGAGSLAASAMLNTQVAAASGLLAWILGERIRYGKPTTLGAASGAVAGLVAITPAAGYVTGLSAIAIGAISGLVCHLAVGLKRWFNVDDALDVAAVHLGGGLIGCICVGLFATTSVNADGANGLFYSGSYRLLGVQAGTAGVVAVLRVPRDVADRDRPQPRRRPADPAPARKYWAGSVAARRGGLRPRTGGAGQPAHRRRGRSAGSGLAVRRDARTLSTG